MASPETGAPFMSNLLINSGKGSPSGSKTPDSTSGCHSPGSPIRDDACPICLGSITEKCVAGSCFHNFCFVCLKEWSKQKAVCPLCKQPFTKIMYNIKSETDYKEWIVPKPTDSFSSMLNEFLRTTERNFFGYRTTNTGRSRALYHLPYFRRRLVPSSTLLPSNGVLPNAPRGEMVTRSQNRGSSLFRLSVYLNNVWVQPLADITGQYRESSPNMYREMPGMTHRLVPWVNREVAALLPASRVGVVLAEIMDLIERYPINSREFRHAVRPHFGSRTRHFIHEFYNFARSPFDMVGHDNAARYIPHYEVENDASSDSDDDIIEVGANGDPVEPLDLSSRPAIEEVHPDMIDISLVISSENSSGNEDEENIYQELFSETHNPQPPSSLNRHSRQHSSMPFEDSNLGELINDVNLEEPGPSGIFIPSSIGSFPIKREEAQNGESSDECEIISVLKPKKDRTPEVINLTSDSEPEISKVKGNSKTHWKKKMSKLVECKPDSFSSRKGKRLRLDRTSFSLHISGTLNCTDGVSPSSSCTSSCRILSKDHTFCTEGETNEKYNSRELRDKEIEPRSPRLLRKLTHRIHYAGSDMEETPVHCTFLSRRNSASGMAKRGRRVIMDDEDDVSSDNEKDSYRGFRRRIKDSSVTHRIQSTSKSDYQLRKFDRVGKDARLSSERTSKGIKYKKHHSSKYKSSSRSVSEKSNSRKRNAYYYNSDSSITSDSNTSFDSSTSTSSISTHSSTSITSSSDSYASMSDSTYSDSLHSSHQNTKYRTKSSPKNDEKVKSKKGKDKKKSLKKKEREMTHKRKGNEPKRQSKIAQKHRS